VIAYFWFAQKLRNAVTCVLYTNYCESKGAILLDWVPNLSVIVLVADIDFKQKWRL
jgi:hypothetical protein